MTIDSFDINKYRNNTEKQNKNSATRMIANCLFI